MDLLTRIIALEPENGAWYERRAQVLVDLKRFEPAVNDFNTAVSLYAPDYRSLGLLSNRALAYEGLSDWEAAVRDYSEAIRLSRDIGGVPPYVLNSRGNALVRTRHCAARARARLCFVAMRGFTVVRGQTKSKRNYTTLRWGAHIH